MFLLGQHNKVGVSGEMHFPPVDAYPTYKQYKNFYSNSNNSKLKTVHYKRGSFKDEITGIQLVFVDGTSSPFFENSYYANDSTLYSLNIETSKHVRKIGMRISGGDYLYGLCFYDSNDLIK